MSKVYTTLDAYQAGFLFLRGHSHELIEQGEKVVFVFGANEALYRDLTDYASGALVRASEFATAIKGLKAEIYGLRMNKGKRYVQRKEKGK
jgi:hypothetical protein